jgi:hypothetical protein
MKFLRTALVIGASVSAAIVPALAGAAPVWPASRIVLLPAGAKGVPSGYLPALACSSVGNCVAGGGYTNAAGTNEGLLFSQVNGAWRSPVTITPPANAAAIAGINVFADACGATGYCSAVGTYFDKSNNSQAFVDSEVGGVWRGAVAVALPANAVVSNQNAQLHSVACSSGGNCSAVGTYSAKASPLAATEGLVVNEVAGVWQRASEVRLPPGTNVNPFVLLNQVACASPGNCSAVGSYIDSNGATHGLLVSEFANRWLAGLALALPANASSFPDASLSSIACISAGNCDAIGTYDNTQGDVEGLTVVQSSRSWKRASAMAMPPSAASNPRVFFYGFNGISCSSLGNCSAGGQYRDSAGDYQGFMVNDVNSTWQVADELKLPASAPQVGKNGGVVALTCPSNGNCSAGAAYLDATGNYQAVVVNRVNGTWLTGVKVTLPGGATSVGVDGGVYGLICKAVNQCTATGSYQRTATVYEGFTLSSN